MSRVLLALVLSLVSALNATAQTNQAAQVIVTRGHASLNRAPDLAWVSIAAEARAETPADAQRLAAEAMTTAQAALAAAGLAADAIRTTGYSLRPNMQYQQGQTTILGYIANNQIEVRVDDLSNLGSVLDAAGSSGATAMSGLRFDVRDRADVEREALRLAVEDAMGRARAMASGAGGTLGDIVRIEEQGFTQPPQQQRLMMRAEAAQVQTPVSPGELEIVASVMLTVQIR